MYIRLAAGKDIVTVKLVPSIYIPQDVDREIPVVKY